METEEIDAIDRWIDGWMDRCMDGPAVTAVETEELVGGPLGIPASRATITITITITITNYAVRSWIYGWIDR